MAAPPKRAAAPMAPVWMAAPPVDVEVTVSPAELVVVWTLPAEVALLLAEEDKEDVLELMLLARELETEARDEEADAAAEPVRVEAEASALERLERAEASALLMEDWTLDAAEETELVTEAMELATSLADEAEDAAAVDAEERELLDDPKADSVAELRALAALSVMEEITDP